MRDHPRRCGENYLAAFQAVREQESPPQVRGKLRRHNSFRFRAGITPAGAGKTSTASRNAIGTWGSPPQVRGKREFAKLGLEYRGITPAGAGKTERLILDAEALEDHPRRCGENPDGGAVKCLNIGSPPQVRGKPLCCRHRYLRSRITPAGAGKTSCWSRSAASTWDHPRRCGEN